MSINYGTGPFYDAVGVLRHACRCRWPGRHIAKSSAAKYWCTALRMTAGRFQARLQRATGGTAGRWLDDVAPPLRYRLLGPGRIIARRLLVTGAACMALKRKLLARNNKTWMRVFR